MMPVFRFRKRRKIELMAKDVWTGLTAFVNKAGSSGWQNIPETKERIKTLKKMRKQYRKGELAVFDADTEKLISDAISFRTRVVSAEYKD